MTTLDEILENLGQRASEFTEGTSDARRPSWGPALVVSDEFTGLARAFGLWPRTIRDRAVVGSLPRPAAGGTLLQQEIPRASHFRMLAVAASTCMLALNAAASVSLCQTRRRQVGIRPAWMARRVTWEIDCLWHKRADLRRHLIYLRELLEERGGPEQQPNIADDLAQSQLDTTGSN